MERYKVVQSEECGFDIWDEWTKTHIVLESTREFCLGFIAGLTYKD